MIRALTFICILASLHLSSNAIAQPDLSYYLPDSVSYDPKVPTPKSILGHEVGEWHVSHDRLVNYMLKLDEASDRISAEIIGYTNEARPLLILTITSPDNHRNIETIRKQHLSLSEGAGAKPDVSKMPSVFYLGCSIHGNESSGSNAAMLMAYHLAAARGETFDNMLQNVVILLDPAFNPDGLQRFSTWVNSRKSKFISTDANDTEHNESWPTGRTNHYWADLNRDWIVAQQPESQARLKKFHAWRPNLLTDHHEMGTNTTFFFQPGVPSRKHPLTPQRNADLTQKIGTYHAKALDAIGSLYYTQEGFDDFYHGKGSSFPDIQGGIGILFEQASSRGHAQESTNGILRFPFTIRNQFTTMLSSLKAVTEMREELLNYQYQFFQDALAEASIDPIKSIVVGSNDKIRTAEIADIFLRHNIELLKLKENMTINGKQFNADASFLIPLEQRQYKLIKSMTEKRTKFNDSIFYDISAWNIPFAGGMNYEELKTIPSAGEKISVTTRTPGKLIGKADYAFAFETKSYYSPRAINRLLQNDIRCKISSEEFTHSSGKKISIGSMIIPLEGQDKSQDAIGYILNEILTKDFIDVYGFESATNDEGPDLGSNTFSALRKPEIALLVDGGVSASEAGEIWNELDTRFQIPLTLMPVQLVNSANLNRYNTIIFPRGLYTSINESGKERLKAWIQNGGVVIGFEAALAWLNGCGFGKFEMKRSEEGDNHKSIPYGAIDFTRNAQETSGAIFQVEADLSHPLLYGYTNSTIPVFKGNNIFIEKSKNPFGNPIVYKSNPLLSGYISKQNLGKLKDTSYAGVSVLGKGRIIGFADNVTFRSFWFGTSKMLTNAIFYGHLINDNSQR